MTLQVTFENKPCYKIVCVSGNPETGVLSGIGDELPLSSYLKELGFQNRKIAIVTDETVGALYGESIRMEASVISNHVRVIVLPSGEEHKHLGTVHKIYDMLLEEHFDRHDVLIALGGGVVGDICGFAAATYLRGIAFVQVPTTLLAACDSSIGGKTGVDLNGYKNMVGAFYMPKLVYLHTQVLKTLPARQVLSGLAEVIKYGLICDGAFYERVVNALRGRDFFALLENEPEEAVYLITQSCRYKKEVVEEDPKEEGRRAILNFGHTIGHAIEKVSEFSLLHGECVALGSIAAAFLCKERGMIPEEAYAKLKSDFASISLPVSLTSLDRNMNRDAVLNAMRSDKKADAGKIKFVLLEGIGHAVVCDDIKEEEVVSALREIGVD
ncbi:MAG: 3-dehydroquinate synthase [Lachnospiraceae bacterium]|nr:3-dehydroquinate synthase [Lachnospiraceae bacterium]